MTGSPSDSHYDPPPGPVARFDRVALLYRVMEYLSFGPLLERCRFFHLPALLSCRRALVIGDGDGRFLARLLPANPQLHADAVDSSPAMLRLLAGRVAAMGAQDRLTTLCADARTSLPAASGYDLVVTHFFLDCLSAAEAEQLIARVRARLAPGALWLVSEFQVPAAGRLRAWLARSVIAALYAAFRLLTGLTVRQIPPWRESLALSGFHCEAARTWLGGLLVSELWASELISPASGPWSQTTTADPRHSHSAVLTHFEFAPPSGSVPGLDPAPFPGLPPEPKPEPAPGPPPEPDPEPYPGPIPAPQPVT